MKKLGLALGAGGMRGFAHVGFMSVLEENNVKAEVIAGSSIGSVFGALFAVGLDSATIMKLAKGLGRDPWLDFVLPKKGLISTKNIYEIMKLLTKGQRIEDLSIAFATVGTDLRSGAEYVFREGMVVDAVCGSLCVPGVFEPYEYKDMLLADGAVSDPTPTTTVREMGANVIVAVDLANADIVEGLDNIYDVIVRSLDLMERSLHSYKHIAEQCDVLVRPNFSACGLNGLTDFSKMDECYAAGREAALEALPTILQLMRE